MFCNNCGKQITNGKYCEICSDNKRRGSRVDPNKYPKAIITRNENGCYDIEMSWE